MAFAKELRGFEIRLHLFGRPIHYVLALRLRTCLGMMDTNVAQQKRKWESKWDFVSGEFETLRLRRTADGAIVNVVYIFLETHRDRKIGQGIGLFWVASAFTRQCSEPLML